MMEKIFAWVLVGVLCLLLCVSVICNVCQLCSARLLLQQLGQGASASIEGQQGRTEPISQDIEEALAEKEKSAETEELLPEKPEKTLLPDKNETALLELESVHANGEFNEEGYACCGKMVLYLKGLLAENTNDVLEKISIVPKPSVLGRIVSDKGKLVINGVFECGKEYLVTVPAGLQAQNGRTAKEACYVAKVKKPRRILGFHEPGMFYPVTLNDNGLGQCSVSVDMFDIDNVKVTIHKLLNDNMDIGGVIAAHHYDRSAKDVMHKVAEKTFAANLRANCRETVQLDIGEMLNGAEAGLYSIELTSVRADGELEYDWWNIEGEKQMTLVLSNLGISVAHSKTGRDLAFFVRWLDTLKPVAGAKVRAYTDKHILLGEACTGKDGSVLVNYSEIASKLAENPSFVVVEKDGDYSILYINDDSFLSNADFSNVGRKFQEYNAFIYTERGIYRPGESVNVSLFVRRNENGELLACELPLEIRLMDSRNNVVGRQSVMTNADGFATVAFALGNTVASGVYTAMCGIAGEEPWNTCTFNVGAFTPNRVKVEITSDSSYITKEENLDVTVSGQFYFGKPLESGRIRCKIYDMGCVRPTHWKEYEVGEESNNNEGKFISELPVYNYRDFTEKTFEVKDIYTAMEKEDVNMTLPHKLRIVAEVTEALERTVSDAVDVVMDTHPLYLGMKYAHAIGQDAIIDCRLLAYDKEVDISDDTVNIPIILRRKEWKYVLVNNGAQNVREWREVVVSEEKLEEPLKIGSGGAVLTLKDLDFGHYELEANDGKKFRTKVDFWHWYGEGGSTRSSNPAVLTVTADAESYAPGEIASLTYYAKKGVLHIAAGESELTDVRSVETVPGENKLRIAIPQRIIGNAYFVELSLVELDDEDNAQRSYALLRVPVKQDIHRMHLALQVVEKAESGETLNIGITAKGQNGEELDGTVQLFAVDEGVLSLTGFQTPDIFYFFHGKYYCDFETHDIYSSIFPKQSMRAPRKIGGGDGSAYLRPENLKLKDSAVVVLPAIRLKDGRAEATMKLPQHTGSMRIMAVAGGRYQVGGASASLTMIDKATVEASLPTVVAEQDDFTASFKIFNHELEEGNAVFSILPAAGLKTEKSLKQKLLVKKGASSVISFRMQAEKTGIQEVAYSLEIGGKTYTGCEYVNVRPKHAPIVRSRIMVLKPGDSLELPNDDWIQLQEKEVNVSPSPAISAQCSLNWLNSYPYGCLEQTTACAFPFLALDKLVASEIITPAIAAAYSSKVEQAVIRILSMCRGTRGFSMWPDSGSIWGEGSVFAAHFLALSKSKVLYAGTCKDIQAFLRAYMEQTELEYNSAYAAYVLALMGDDFGARKILQNAGKYKDMGMALFMRGAALVKAGYASKGMPLIKEALERNVWNDGNASWCLSGKEACQAVVLSIGMEIVPEHEKMTQLAMELSSGMRHDNTGYGTTGSNAWCTYGLAAYAAYYQAKSSEVDVVINGRNVHKLVTKKEKIDDLKKITNTGNGCVFITVRESGIPRQSQSNGCIKVKKVYLNDKGEPAKKVRRGDLLTVKITMDYSGSISNAVLADLLPGGFEIENGTLATRNGIVSSSNSGYSIQHCEMLQDRYLLFFETESGNCTFSYNIRAVYPGTYAIPSLSVKDMYAPDIFGGTGANLQLTIDNE